MSALLAQLGEYRNGNPRVAGRLTLHLEHIYICVYVYVYMYIYVYIYIYINILIYFFHFSVIVGAPNGTSNYLFKCTNATCDPLDIKNNKTTKGTLKRFFLQTS